MTAGRRPRSRRSRRQAGVTLVELLLAIGATAAVAVGGTMLVRPDAAGRAAAAHRAFLLSGRTRALWTGRPVAVVPDGVHGLVARTDEAGDPAGSCAGGTLAALDVTRFRGVRVTRPLREGIVWLPDGGARSCSGGGVISATIELAGVRSAARVVVSSLGRVRVETAP